MKRSESLVKSTLPGRKTVARHVDDDGYFRADAVHLVGEPPPARMLHPHEPLQRLDLRGFRSEPLLRPVVRDGRPEAPLATVSEAARYAQQREQQLPPEHRRFENPHTYKVGISPGLADLRDRLLHED